MEFGVCRWMVDFVQIIMFGVACGVGTDAVDQELLTFLHALRDVESDIRSWCRSPLRTLGCRGGPESASGMLWRGIRSLTALPGWDRSRLAT
ncbi:MAG TPA: hypothetical protein VLL82_11090 [Mycobacterium sp.]|nr:hypothetical protein [Mycobacterium sp.]